MDLIGVKETSSATSPQATQGLAASTDRRRPGRIEVSESLLPLLRAGPEPVGPPVAAIDIIAMEGEGDDMLAPARGIGFGLLVSVPLWALIAACLAAFIR